MTMAHTCGSPSTLLLHAKRSAESGNCLPQIVLPPVRKQDRRHDQVLGDRSDELGSLVDGYLADELSRAHRSKK